VGRPYYALLAPKHDSSIISIPMPRGERYLLSPCLLGYRQRRTPGMVSKWPPLHIGLSRHTRRPAWRRGSEASTLLERLLGYGPVPRMPCP